MKPHKLAPKGRPVPFTVPVLYSIATVAAKLDVSTKTVRRWIGNGLLHHHRLGRQIRITDTDLVVFLNSHRT